MATSTALPRLADHGLHVQIYARGSLAPLRWRLVGGNNRDLGRGTTDFPDEESCLVGIKEVVKNLEHLVPGLVRATGNRWSWRLSLAAEVVVVSGHSFDRRRRCEDGWVRFVELMPTAEVREGVSYLFAGGAATDWGRASVLGARQGVGGSLPGVHHLFSYDSPRSGLLGPGKLTPHGTGEDSA
jgi:hypothetical protein